MPDVADQMLSRDVPWRRKSLAMKIVSVPTAALAVIFTSCLLIVGGLETSSLSQPSRPTAAYPYPHAIKSGVKCFSEWQEHVYAIAKPAMLAAFPLLMLMFGIYDVLRRRDFERRKRMLFDNLDRANNDPAPPRDEIDNCI